MNFPTATGAAQSVLYYTGRDFHPAHDGQGKRLELLTRYFADHFPDVPRHLLSPVQPLPDDLLRAGGWNWRRVPARHRKRLRNAILLSRLAAWWYLRLGRKENVFTSFTSVPDLCTRATAPLFADPHALVVIGSCLYAGMTRFKRPEQRWILDSNDSAWCRADAYGMTEPYRRLLGISRSRWHGDIRRLELELAASFDRIICISRDDQDYFNAAVPQTTFLEDTDIVVPPDYRREAKPSFDVGLVGGNHTGSVTTARNLLTIAAHPGLAHLRLAVAGTVCRLLDRDPLPSNVTLCGRVDSSLDFLGRCRAALVLTGKETGASVKYQEALAAGCVVVANRHAARHSLAHAGVTHLEVESIEDAAALLQSPGFQSFAPPDLREHFSYPAFARRFTEALG